MRKMRKYVCLPLVGSCADWRFGVRLTFLLCFITIVGFAAGPLPADHYNVYAAFFQDHTVWQQAVAAQAGGNAAAKSSLVNTAASLMHVDAKEADVVSTVVTQTVAGLAALDSQRTAYIGASNGKPSSSALEQFEIRRQQAIMIGVTQLQRNLTRLSWSGLHTYINWDQRINGTTLPKGGK